MTTEVIPTDPRLLDERIAAETDNQNRETLIAIRLARQRPDEVLAVLSLARRMGWATDDPRTILNKMGALTE